MKNKSNSLKIADNPEARGLLHKKQAIVYRNTSYLFAALMSFQWVASVVIAWFVSPLTWNGTQSQIHPHVWTAIIFGGAITSLPVSLALKYPEAKYTRYTIAVGQMMMSGLLIHLTGGRIETHFHIFGSLAFLSFYRDWRVMIPATIVTAADHIFRGWFYPQSMYGILTGGEWRWIEHAAWVVFEDIFLIASCVANAKEMRTIAVNSAALNANEARYRAVVEQMSEGIYLLEPETFRVIECNQTFANLIGCKDIEEAKTLTVFDFTNLEEREVKNMVKIIRQKNHSMSIEIKYVHRDGSPLDFEVSGRIIFYNGIEAYCMNVRDISARRKAQDEINRLALVAQKTVNSVSIIDPEGRIQWVNDSFLKQIDYEFDEVIGKSPVELMQGKETDVEMIKTINEAISQRKSFNGEIYKYGKKGNGFWLSKSITPFHNSKGEFEGFVSVAMDITERKKMETELLIARDDLENRIARRTSELIESNKKMMAEVTERAKIEQQLSKIRKFLLSVIDNVPNLIFVKDGQGKFTLVNRSLAEYYGLEIKDMIGKTDLDFAKNKEEAMQFQMDDQEVIKNWTEKVIFEEKLTDKKGNVRWLHTVKRPLIDSSGVKSVLGISTDLTERKILEGQLHHSQKLESIGQLAAGIAHEINTPTQYVGDNTRFIRDAFEDLNGVLEKYDQLLEAARNSSITPELIADIEKEIEDADLEYIIEETPNAVNQSLEGISRIAQIVQSMKDFAHPGSTDKAMADINKAIESTVTVARNEWKYLADLEMNFDNSLPPVPCLLGELNQVILNMVINASHAIADVVGDGSNGKGKITITTTRANEDWAEIRISDSGTGIPLEAQNRVFDPFFTTKEVGKGTGQGLAISHTVIVDKHNGKLNFETEQGKGTTFIIQLPLNSIENSILNT